MDEMGARESIPICILLHPSSNHDVPEERRDEARRQEPLAEEAKQCVLKLPMEIKRIARIPCGGRVSTGAIASRHHIKDERVSTPVRRSERIRGMKRKDYKEVSPEPKDYRGVIFL
jgi:hypothetical protein